MTKGYRYKTGDKGNHLLTIACYILISCLTGLIIALVPEPDAVGIAGLTLFFLILICFALIQPYKEIRRVIIIAFVLRAMLALFHVFILPLPDSQADAVRLEQLGWEFARGWESGLPLKLVTGSQFYSLIIGLVYFVTDRSPLLIQGINVLFGTFIVYNTGAIARLFYGPKVAVTASWIACLFPTLLLYSAITLRETAVVFCFSLFILFLSRWIQDDRVSQLLKSVTMLFLASLFHSGMIFLMVLPVMFLLYKVSKAYTRAQTKSFMKLSIVTCILLAFLCIPALTGVGLGKFQDLHQLTSIDYIGDRHELQARDRAAYLQNITITSATDLIYVVPLKMLYFLFAPFPWQVRAPIDIIGLIDGMFYFFLAACTVYGLIKIYKEHGKSAFWGLTAVLLVAIGVFAMGTGNYGTALRHRAKFAFLFISIASPAIHYYIRQRFFYKKNKLNQFP